VETWGSQQTFDRVEAALLGVCPSHPRVLGSQLGPFLEGYHWTNCAALGISELVYFAPVTPSPDAPGGGTISGLAGAARSSSMEAVTASPICPFWRLDM